MERDADEKARKVRPRVKAFPPQLKHIRWAAAIPGTGNVENTAEYRVGSPFAQEPSTVIHGNPPPHQPEAATAGAVLPGRQSTARAAAGDGKQIAMSEPETLGDGVWGQTALAGVYAAILLLGFAAACWLIFPGGGVAVAALGAAVSFAGLSSRHVRLATLTLILHGIFFFACYLRAI